MEKLKKLLQNLKFVFETEELFSSSGRLASEPSSFFELLRSERIPEFARVQSGPAVGHGFFRAFIAFENIPLSSNAGVSRNSSNAGKDSLLSLFSFEKINDSNIPAGTSDRRKENKSIFRELFEMEKIPGKGQR